MRVILALACMAAMPPRSQASAAGPAIAVVAAENFYGDVARQVGGADVSVYSILTNPDQDPHLFEVSPSVARAVSAARIVICNGIDYDPWMERLLAASHDHDREVVVVGALAGRKAGDNPHVWYQPETMSLLAVALAARYAALDPAHASGYGRRLAGFQAALAPIRARITEMRLRLAGTRVTATEPVFGYMFDDLGMVSRNQGFQRAVMNETEVSASDLIAFEDDLRSHRVKLLLFDRQATNKVADRMKAIASEASVPTLGATETEPPGLHYQAWITTELDAVDRALPERGR